MKKYPRLDKYYDELIKMEDEEPERIYDQRSYSLMCTLECISNYEFIKDFCLKNNFKSVFDIGCCFGYQSEVFYESGIQYRGLDDTISKYLWNSELYEYQVGRFPCDVKSRKGELGISVLCLGWNCYLYEGAKTLDEQFESLVNQFEYSLIYMQRNLVPLISRHFSKVEHLEDNFYFLKGKLTTTIKEKRGIKMDEKHLITEELIQQRIDKYLDSNWDLVIGQIDQKIEVLIKKVIREAFEYNWSTKSLAHKLLTEKVTAITENLINDYEVDKDEIILKINKQIEKQIRKISVNVTTD